MLLARLRGGAGEGAARNIKVAGLLHKTVVIQFNRRHVERHEHVLPFSRGAAFDVGGVIGNPAVLLIDVHGHVGSDLFEVAGAFDVTRLGPRLIQRRQQHGGKNRDDRDDHQKFNQGKTNSGHDTHLLSF